MLVGSSGGTEYVCFPHLLPVSQVSHHPPAAAHHAESKHGWTLRQEIKITSKFRGKYLSIMPLGESLIGVPTTGLLLMEGYGVLTVL